MEQDYLETFRDPRSHPEANEREQAGYLPDAIKHYTVYVIPESGLQKNSRTRDVRAREHERSTTAGIPTKLLPQYSVPSVRMKYTSG